MPAASLNGTYKTGPGASVTDAQGVVFAINANGQITINGKVDPTTARVDALGFFNGQIWQKNGNNLWFSKTSAAATWANYPPGAGNPMPVPRSANNTRVSIYDGPASSQFYDTHGNLWQINASGQVVIDGRVDPTTARVVAMALVNGKVWQENADGNWYSKMKPSDTWTSAVRADPVLAADAARETWIGGSGGNSPLLGANWSKGVAPTPDRNLAMTSGVMNLGLGNLGGNPLTISGGRGYTSPSSYQGYLAAAPVINIVAGGSLSLAMSDLSTNAVKVNVAGGKVALDVSASHSADVVVTADKLSSVLLSGHMGFGSMTEHGGTILVNGAFVGQGTYMMLDCNLAGFGSICVFDRSLLEVTGSVSADVTVAVRGDPYKGLISEATLDNVAADHGTITLQDAILHLKNVGPIDSMSYKNSMLSLYKGNTLAEVVKVVGVADQPGGVSNGKLNFAYSAGTLTVHDGGAGTITGLALHA